MKNGKLKLNNQWGFTMIELIIVVALIGVMLVVLATFYFTSNRMVDSQNLDLNIGHSARTSLDEIDTYIRQAATTISTYDTFNAGSTVLILEIQSVDSSNILISGTYDRVVIYQQGSQVF